MPLRLAAAAAHATGPGARGPRRPLAVALRRLRRRFPFDLVHAHNAVPAGDAVRRARHRGAARRLGARRRRLPHRAAVAGRPARPSARAFGARGSCSPTAPGSEPRRGRSGRSGARVVHLGTDLPRRRRSATPPASSRRCSSPSAHLVARKRHADVLRAHGAPARPAARPALPRRSATARSARALERLAAELGLADRVELTGQLDHATALRRARAATLFVMPSVDEAFGVAYVEAMAGGVPAIGVRGEPGPEEIAAAGEGIRLVPPGDVERARGRDRASSSSDRAALRDARRRARARRSRRAFTWERCGRETVARLRGRAAMTRRPVLLRHEPRAARPRRARSPRCTSRAASSSRCSAGARTTRRRGVADPGVPHRHVAQRDVARARGERPLPRGGRAARRRVALPAAWLGARRARVPFVLWSALWARPAHARARRSPGRSWRRSTAAPTRSSPTARTSPLRPPPRRAQRPRRAAGGRQRVLVGAGRRAGRRDGAVHGRCSSAATLPREGPRGAARGLAARRRSHPSARGARPRRGGPRRRRERRGVTASGAAVAGGSCATSTRPPTFWSCRPSPSRPSASRGGWSPTRP